MMSFGSVSTMDGAGAIAYLRATAPARAVLWVLLGLSGAGLLWAALGRLDIVAVAHGRLVPQSHLKIVQPAEAGVIKEILVKEGELVRQGQVLMRMDAVIAEADVNVTEAGYRRQRLTLRRIDAELAGKPLAPESGEPPDLFAAALAQYRANRLAYLTALDEQRSAMERARHELAMAMAIRTKLEQGLSNYREREQAYAQLGQAGFAGRLLVADRQRERIEREQDLKAQTLAIESAEAAMRQAQTRMEQIRANYRRALLAERTQAAMQLDQLQQERAKLAHRQERLELRAPRGGIVKDLATHTAGTVVAPGSVVLTLVPADEPVMAEVWVANEDIGFVRPARPVKLKLGAFPFQKYGMVDGVVEQVSADASEAPASSDAQGTAGRLAYKARIRLAAQYLANARQAYPLAPGMQVTAEIWLGTRTVLEYLLSPVTGAFQEAARER